jgi:hypothetical protein
MFDAIHISDDELEALPDDGVEGFLAYEALVREKLRVKGEAEQSGEPSSDQRFSYLTHVSEAADHYGIPELDGLRIEPGTSLGASETRAIAQTIEREVTKLRLKARRNRQNTHVQISDSRRGTLKQHIAELRVRIVESELDDKKQAALNKKLDELLAELTGTKKVDLAKTLLIIGGVLNILNLAQQNVVRLPETMAFVAGLLTESKAEADTKLIPAKPQLLIEDQSAAGVHDDDIPF